MTKTRTRFTQEEVADILRQRRAGVPVASLVGIYGRQRSIYTVLQEAAAGIERADRPLDQEIADVVQQWDDGVALHRIARNCGRSRDWVGRVLRDAGRKLENRPFRASAGDRVRHVSGYVLVHVADDDPHADMRTETGLVLEHRLVLARVLGRSLRPRETVHHINGVRNDNRSENLQLRQGNHGQGIAVVCLDCGSHNVEALPLAQE